MDRDAEPWASRKSRNPPVKLEDVRDAFDFISMGDPYENRASIRIATGTVHFARELDQGPEKIDEEELEESGGLIYLPGKYDLDLGQRLVFAFAGQMLWTKTPPGSGICLAAGAPGGVPGLRKPEPGPPGATGVAVPTEPPDPFRGRDRIGCGWRLLVSGGLFLDNPHRQIQEFPMSRASAQPIALDDLVSGRSAARLRAFRRDVERALPGLVDSMLLFGSRARGEAYRNSDYDVAVLLRGVSRPANIRTVLSDTAYRHVRAGVPIRPLAVMANDVSENGPFPVTRNIARHGIVIS